MLDDDDSNDGAKSEKREDGPLILPEGVSEVSLVYDLLVNSLPFNAR